MYRDSRINLAINATLCHILTMNIITLLNKNQFKKLSISESILKTINNLCRNYEA